MEYYEKWEMRNVNVLWVEMEMEMKRNENKVPFFFLPKIFFFLSFVFFLFRSPGSRSTLKYTNTIVILFFFFHFPTFFPSIFPSPEFQVDV